MSQSNIPENIQISFIVPVYNVELYIERCLESIIKVNVEKEIILIDDGSTDGSRQILEKYQTQYPYITLVFQKNSGVSAARNVGIKLAKGKYLQFIDSDDYLLNHDYHNLITLAESYHADLFRGKYQFIINNKPQEDKNILDFKENEIAKISHAQSFLVEMNKDCNFSPKICCSFFKTEIIKRHNIFFNQHLYMGEDIIFVFDFLTASAEIKVMEIPQALYAYFFRNGSATQSLNAKTIEGIFNLTEELWKKYNYHESKQEDIFCKNLYRMVLGQYNSAYIYYKNLNNEEKQKAKYLFSQKVIDLIERHSNYKVLL